MSQAYMGQIIIFAGNFAPRNWAFCQGQMMYISQNTALFSLLGTTYGGNGTQTFALPDLRGRAPVGAGSGTGLSPYVLGQMTGSENVTLTAAQMPVHSHQVSANATTGSTTNPTNNFLAAGQDPTSGDDVNTYATGSSGVVMNPGMVAPSGGSQPHSNIQPILGINYIICIQGIYPIRN